MFLLKTIQQSACKSPKTVPLPFLETPSPQGSILPSCYQGASAGTPGFVHQKKWGRMYKWCKTCKKWFTESRFDVFLGGQETRWKWWKHMKASQLTHCPCNPETRWSIKLHGSDGTCGNCMCCEAHTVKQLNAAAELDFKRGKTWKNKHVLNNQTIYKIYKGEKADQGSANSSNNHPEEKTSKGLHLHGPEWSSAK